VRRGRGERAWAAGRRATPAQGWQFSAGLRPLLTHCTFAHPSCLLPPCPLLTNSPPPCARPCRCSNALFLVGGLLLELTTNASWAAGFRDSLWYPQWWEMLAIQAVIGVSAGTGLVLTAENRKGAERLVFQAYGLQVLQVRAFMVGAASAACRLSLACTACSMPATLLQHWAMHGALTS